ncbi:hypothetical protein HPB49_010027 [Dermacentor silvarum]|uniref:Uncharacterized protein n=1 Tax=Dermacentor silvarum TaxID=543639 RepID=A0ACB8CKL1_DERSI|nr:hypothetical protein HPB49_010027 [Dermacentor silvarum]
MHCPLTVSMSYSFQLVLPNYATHSSFESLQPAVKFYMADMEPKNLKVIKGEWEMGKQKWQATPPEELPKYVTEALKQCNTSLFTNIRYSAQDTCHTSCHHSRS